MKITERAAVVDVDDLVEEQQIIEHLLPLREKVPDLLVTCYAVPNKLGPVLGLAAKYPWVGFAIHGWEHTHFEALTWSDEKAYAYLRRALDMGYLPLFKPPNWVCHEEIEAACHKAQVVLHHHAVNYTPTLKGLMVFPGPRRRQDIISVHSHISPNPVTDWVKTHPGFTPEALSLFEKFTTPINAATVIL